MKSAIHSGPLRVGFAGCGFVTRNRHLPTLRRVKEIEVAALADLDPAALSEVADRYGVSRRHGSAESLVRDSEVEAVAVCVPVGAHVEVALAALEAGKHVFLEKPLALHLEDADRLVARAADFSSRVMVGFNLRWHRNLRAARQIVASGALGRIQSLSTVFSDPVLSRTGLPAWRSSRAAGGGVLLDKLVHHFDLWRFLLADEVKEVFTLSHSGRGDDDTVSVTARMAGGTLVTTLGMDDAFMKHEVTIYGERGGVHVDCYRFDGLRRYGVSDMPGAPRTRLRHFAAMLRESRASLAAIRRGGDFDASYDGEWRHFVESIRSGRPPECGLADGRAAMQISLAADRSRSLGEPVSIASGSTRVPVA
ncbi:MAG: Gfo/Idh/MocA family oxidoreductase [Gemmatimonadales bacterium]|nr:Gfo/Idh/MocA family oxidoreductase [Gemmatimonadales bacterium]